MTSPMPTSDDSDLDFAVLERLVGASPVRLRKFAALFQQSMDEVLARVDEALVRSDLVALGEMGHRAKSTARNVGANALADACLGLERAAKAHDVDGALALARGLRQRYIRVREALLRRPELQADGTPPAAQ